ncbi:phosphate uptake regulator, PhoU [Caminicella sporogenes DSM 14501]|uniref:Phosphate-specific transport system accessory protein PhoU n=1 Tax=Caminicella sporogenes DSM 14501 TaxID=1121266 RepID=A0A1M6QIA3_9FIRM|nr:phosphate signaling complex protein PhoU [Caminicella sporogenes]RKD25303.1 phosphate transport system regulatory protein PhoU [Caminicella sporogenes]WIF95302.1 phosphate signaling complex protein PhoU [Caminicella sporogenes]SHK19908.1 phosphate uptake regulator, PhoU [Caminicella sporogenes DSM 14501]
MVREGFESSLKSLKEEVVNMMEKVSKLIQDSVDSLVNRDIKLAREVIKKDDEIDKLMNDIEEKTIELIALQQPMAKDLRIIFSISKIITDIERVGDFCVNICKETIKIGHEEHIKPLIDIPKMRDIILEMFANTKESFINENYKLAYRVGEDDEIIDNLYKDIYTEILMMIHEDSKFISQGTKLLFVGRYLERMADHITNICERIIYISQGDRVSIN